MAKTPRDLPPCVHLKHGAYYLVKRNKWTPLGRDREAALRLYASLTAPASSGMSTLIDEAITARTGLRLSTRKQYITAGAHLKHAFQDFQPHEVQPRHVAEFRRSMSDRPNMANRCLSVLRLVFSYALEQQLVDRNPVIGVDRMHEPKRSRLLTPDEYAAIYAHAGPRLQIIMDVCYLTGQRISDVLAIRRSQIRDGGIEFTQAKTGKRLLVRAPGLPEVIERAKALHGAVGALTLFRSRDGGAPGYKTIRDKWTVVCRKAGVPDAHLHDLRAMSLTAAKAQGLDATALAGHTSAAMTARYLRSKEVPEVAGPALRHALDSRQKS